MWMQYTVVRLDKETGETKYWSLDSEQHWTTDLFWVQCWNTRKQADEVLAVYTRYPPLPRYEIKVKYMGLHKQRHGLDVNFDERTAK